MRAGQDLDDLYGDDQSVDDLSVGDLSVLYTREKGGKTKTEPLTRSNRPVSFHRANVVSTGRSPDRVCVRVFFFTHRHSARPYMNAHKYKEHFAY